MKIKFVLLHLIVLFSCSSLEKNKMNCDTRILGYWTILYANGISCNACPKVNFLNCQEGFLIKPSKEVLNFTFEIKNDSILFSEIKSPFLHDRLYNYKILVEEQIVTLELNSNKSKLILSRSKD